MRFIIPIGLQKGDILEIDGKVFKIIKNFGGSRKITFNYEGRRHREDGPADEEDGEESWWLDDKFYGESKPDNWDELVAKYKAEQLLNT